MIDKILEISLRQRAFVLLAAFALLGVGLWSGSRLPIDAVPDITGVQVQINTEVPALAAEESERLVTRPIEIEMAGLPGLKRCARSQSWSVAGHAPIRRRNRHLSRATTCDGALTSSSRTLAAKCCAETRADQHRSG